MEIVRLLWGRGAFDAGAHLQDLPMYRLCCVAYEPANQQRHYEIRAERLTRRSISGYHYRQFRLRGLRSIVIVFKWLSD